MVTISVFRGPARLSDVRALIVEDDHDTREMLQEFLALDGAVVFGAKSGAEGFEVFQRERPDVVVSDLWMPGGDGYGMIRRIRALPAEQGGLTPAIAVSAAEAVRPALVAGFHAFSAKPFDIETLIDIIADFTKTHETTGERVKPWNVVSPRAGLVVVDLLGQVRAADMRELVAAFLPLVQQCRSDVVVDLRQLIGCAPSVASVAERGVWELRKQIRGVRIIGGPVLARLVTASACAVLGVPSTIAEPESPAE